ncbi:hypothetical protein EB796_012821 [Bugula neritina]|uniref:Uncharacterized protein n=1 Tax=Bugula neritina TaxID=10212 RepID=A0A7J7JTT6_BUGNE|nr:hypothetical protein EB796_012821 [Bugula neritina]
MGDEYQGRVLVYSLTGCAHCKAAKHTLTTLNVPFTDVSIDQYDSSVRQEVKERTGKSTVPQIFFNDVYIGGNVELQEVVKDKEKWSELIANIRSNPPNDQSPALPDDSLKIGDSDSTLSAEADDMLACEPDEFARLVTEIKSSGIIADHRSGIFKQKRTFTGRDFVAYVMKAKNMDESAATDQGQQLLQRHFIYAVKHQQGFSNSDNLFRLLEDDNSGALNQGETSCQPSSVNELGEELRKLILKVYSIYLSADGRKVDYDGISRSSEFKLYQKLALQLHRVEVETASREEKLAFFINVYNALVVHANVVKGPPTNMWQRYKFFNNMKYIIGGELYSLQDIENGVLRANRKGVGMIFRPFSVSDARYKVALEHHEPLIHFALVCGAKSCPPIKTYSADGVMDQLKTAAQAFLEGEDVLVDIEKGTVALSKIFQWYKEDFGGTDSSLIGWICDNMDQSEKRDQLKKLHASGRYKVHFLTYDWSTNS